MRAELESLGRQITFKEGEEKRLRALIGQYQARLEAVPGIESEWVALTRDYDTLAASYRELLSKSENSKMAASLEQRQIGEQFRILDPPRCRDPTVGPRRINLMGTAAGLGVGLLWWAGLFGIRPCAPRPTCWGDRVAGAGAPAVRRRRGHSPAEAAAPAQVGSRRAGFAATRPWSGSSGSGSSSVGSVMGWIDEALRRSNVDAAQGTGRGARRRLALAGRAAAKSTPAVPVEVETAGRRGGDARRSAAGRVEDGGAAAGRAVRGLAATLLRARNERPQEHHRDVALARRRQEPRGRELA
jgi:hypothetical protein